MTGDDWYERIVYLREGSEPEVLDFRAKLVGDELTFDDAAFEGQTYRCGDDVVVFPYRWKDRPGARVVETIVRPTPGHKSRIWQKFENDELIGITIIDERKNPERSPEEWT